MPITQDNLQYYQYNDKYKDDSTLSIPCVPKNQIKEKNDNLLVHFNFAKLKYVFVEDLSTFIDKKPYYVHIDQFDKCVVSFDFESEEIANQKKKDLISFYGSDITVLNNSTKINIGTQEYNKNLINKLRKKMQSNFVTQKQFNNYQFDVKQENQINKQLYQTQLSQKKKHEQEWKSSIVSYSNNDSKAWESWNE